jgi:NAD(P)-dependent dehydrogenase (short-subunit alcohol dehydrogenase family)
VVVTDIDDARGTALATRIGGTYLPQDVTDEQRWTEVIGEIEKRHGRLDVLVANAGIGIMTSILTMSLADWRRQNAINLDGVFLSVKHGIPAMRRSGGGSIVMISSVAGLRGSAGLAGYSATKGGVRLFAKSVALECAAAGDNIRVNSVHPGIIDTPIWGKVSNAGGSGPGHNQPFDPKALAAAAVPLHRPGLASDVADGIVFLASDASSYMTGSELVIDGGMTAGAPPRRPLE